MPPADCADAVKAWFQCVEEANTGQSSEHVQTHSLVSAIASQVQCPSSRVCVKLQLIFFLQNRVCAIDTFDSSKITYLPFLLACVPHPRHYVNLVPAVGSLSLPSAAATSSPLRGFETTWRFAI
jgi:hypothetical protein